jgi:hypothetical protein
MASIGRAANDVSVDAASDELVAGPALRDDTRSRAMGNARWSAVRQWRFVSMVAASPAVLTSKGELGERAEDLCQIGDGSSSSSSTTTTAPGSASPTASRRSCNESAPRQERHAVWVRQRSGAGVILSSGSGPFGPVHVGRAVGAAVLRSVSALRLSDGRRIAGWRAQLSAMGTARWFGCRNGSLEGAHVGEPECVTADAPVAAAYFF